MMRINYWQELSGMESIIYEQPLSELIRFSLRLENLFERLDSTLAAGIEEHTQNIMSLIVDLLNALDRPDLKTKFGKEFNRLIETLSKLHAAPDISTEKLNDTLQQLKVLMRYFITSHGKIGQTLRDNEFLGTIRQNIIKSGGCGTSDSPAYFHWLNQPIEIRQKYIVKWLTQFQEIRHAAALLLGIVRNSSEPCKRIAENGFYHESLDTQAHCQLLRVIVPSEFNIYPEISAGKHRISIRFVVPNVDDHPTQIQKNAPFQLVKCII